MRGLTDVVAVTTSSVWRCLPGTTSASSYFRGNLSSPGNATPVPGRATRHTRVARRCVPARAGRQLRRRPPPDPGTGRLPPSTGGTEMSTETMTPDEEYDFYARPENQEPQGTPRRRAGRLTAPIPVRFPPTCWRRSGGAPRPTTGPCRPGSGGRSSTNSTGSRDVPRVDQPDGLPHRLHAVDN